MNWLAWIVAGAVVAAGLFAGRRWPKWKFTSTTWIIVVVLSIVVFAFDPSWGNAILVAAMAFILLRMKQLESRNKQV